MIGFSGHSNEYLGSLQDVNYLKSLKICTFLKNTLPSSNYLLKFVVIKTKFKKISLQISDEANE